MCTVRYTQAILGGSQNVDRTVAWHLMSQYFGTPVTLRQSWDHPRIYTQYDSPVSEYPGNPIILRQSLDWHIKKFAPVSEYPRNPGILTQSWDDNPRIDTNIYRAENNSWTLDNFWPFHAFVWSKDYFGLPLCLSNNLHITYVWQMIYVGVDIL